MNITNDKNLMFIRRKLSSRQNFIGKICADIGQGQHRTTDANTKQDNLCNFSRKRSSIRNVDVALTVALKLLCEYLSVYGSSRINNKIHHI